MLKNILNIAYITIATIFLLEIALQIYNPLPQRLKGNEINLPTNIKYEFKNDLIDKLDKNIINSKNSIGFRGDEYDGEKFKIFTVGGSTTECFYLSDGKDWTSKLKKKINNSNIFINNAGLDGHSTFGHINLINQYLLKLKPNLIIFLIGINDVQRDDLNNNDKKLEKSFLQNIELYNLTINMLRVINSKNKNLLHKGINFEKLDSIKINRNIKIDSKLLKNYGERINQLIKICKTNKIDYIFMTQPIVWGEGIDDLTKIDLSNRKVGDKSSVEVYLELEMYNNVLREICKNQDIKLIDLAKQLPKNTLYYYDHIHYTELGSEKISQIVFEGLKNFGIV